MENRIEITAQTHDFWRNFKSEKRKVFKKPFPIISFIYFDWLKQILAIKFQVLGTFKHFNLRENYFKFL